jgi:flagellar hook-associated protein 3 FlgL
MFTANIGDMAQSMLLRRQTADLGTRLNTLTDELSTGRKSDLQAHLRGDFSPLSGIERDLKLRSAYAESNEAAAQFADAQQMALEAVSQTIEGRGAEFAQAATDGSGIQMATAAKAAVGDLEQLVSVLNGRQAGRALFSGAATDAQALSSAGDLLTNLEAALAGAATAGDALTAADAFFDAPGGGFETQVYGGSATPLAPFQIGDGETAKLDLTATDPAIRDVLKATALTALTARGLFAGNPAERRELVETAGVQLINAADDVTLLRAELGFAQERIEGAEVRGEAQRVSLEEARNALIGADPYATAMSLQQTETKLATLFQATARLANLSLVNVLR